VSTSDQPLAQRERSSTLRAKDKSKRIVQTQLTSSFQRLYSQIKDEVLWESIKMESFYSQTYSGGKTIQAYQYSIFNHQETTSLL